MNGKQEKGKRRSRAEIERIVEGYEESGLSKQAFCRKHGLSWSTLERGRKKQKRLENAAAGGAEWVPIEVSGTVQEAEAETELVVRLASGRRIEVRKGFEAEALRELVRVLEQI